MSDRNYSGLVQIADQGLCGMITVRADFADVSGVLLGAGIDVPSPGQMNGNALWMSPDELMILCDYAEAEGRVAGLSSALRSHHSLVVNVSDARAVFSLSGESAAIREVFAKLSPADLRETAMPVGRVRRTRLSQVPAAFWFDSPGEARLICFRSVSDYVFSLLCNAADQNSAVGHF